MNSETEITLIEPYGGRLVDLLAREDAGDLARHAAGLPSLQLTPRSLCDLELLATGAFSPLTRFCGREDYFSILETLRLAGGTLFPIPITLSVHDVSGIPLDGEITLRNANNNPMAVMRVEEIFERDPALELKQICGGNPHHPLAREMASWGRYCLSGALRVIQLPVHYDFPELRHTPAEVRQLLAAMGNPNVVAFQTRNPMHRAHEELTKRAAAEAQASLLLQPVVGMTKPGDIDHYTRVRTYKTLVDHHYDPAATLLSLLPLAMRLAGPREAIWHAIIRRNHGANHFIIGRDHAGPGKDPTGKPFYEPYAARELALEHASELGMRILPYDEMVYLVDGDRYEEVTAVPPDARIRSISGTEVREKYLAQGRALPAWFTRKETAEILGMAYPPRHKQGFCVWFTGLPSAGKSTVAEILAVMLMEHGRQATVLDGDVVRTHLSKGLGFSREDRDINILRIGFVASEIVRHHGVAICAAVSPYRATRDQVRGMSPGAFVEVFVDTPLETCEQRDAKGFYRKARAGELKGFTGVDDPYEPPLKPELTLDTVTRTPEENAREIIEYLASKGLLVQNGRPRTPAASFSPVRSRTV
ncbi:MAG: bifunctional sulfate adenylyltransferase/adenylylsulfate kinase [Bryobacterales bacterium]|nr:bifunctional sulfate adenylyltransferase/adenylylsulfate kinase [Bryobacterales bacterium]